MSGRFFRSADSDSDSDSSSEEEEVMSSDEEGSQAADSKPQKTAKQSRFLKDDGDDSDDDSDDDDDDDSDDEDAAKPAAGAKPGMSRFMRGASDDSDSDDDDVKKVIKSAKDKRFDEVDAVIKNIENAQRIGDWVAIAKDYDALLRLIERQRNVNEPIPSSFIKLLPSLEEYLNKSIAEEKNAKKKMKAPNAKAMNGMKQKLKKTLKDNETEVEKFKQDPEAFEAEAQAALAPVPAASSAPRRARAAAGEEDEQGEEDEDFQTVGRGGKSLLLTSEGLFKSLAAVMEARGRKSTDRSEQVQILCKLLEVAVSPYQKIRVLLALIAARFDYNPSASTHMPSNMWDLARKETDLLLKTLHEDPSYVVREETDDYDDSIDRLPNQNEEGPVVAVRGSIISFVDRLDDEFTRSLQNIDPHTTEYVERLSDEKRLYQTMVRAQVYFEKSSKASPSDSSSDALSRVVMRRLEHVYSKQDIIIQALEAANAEAQPGQVSNIVPNASEISQAGGPTKLIRSLCVQLYKAPGVAGDRAKTRAMLYHVYHHALHADYHIARDMFLMSHLQDSIDMADAATQILFNRVVVQLGMCAFRLGLIKESQSSLNEIYATGRVKELLAQGVQRPNAYSTITPEQEKLDRQRQLPFHVHINLELLECIYLVSSMLLEVPNMAFAGEDPELRKKIISRVFRRMLDYTDRQVFSGPPENTRDHIMQATKSLQNGDWKGCIKLIQDIKIWKLMPGWEEVSKMLELRIQEEGLRTYVFTYASYYSSVSLEHLSTTFDLPLKTVRSLVSKMIWNEELAASLDTVTVPIDSTSEASSNSSNTTTRAIIVLHKNERSKVQQLSQTLSERVNSMLEQNERSLDQIVGEGQQSRTNTSGGERSERNDQSGPRREGRSGRGGRGGNRGGRGRAQFQALASLGQKV